MDPRGYQLPNQRAAEQELRSAVLAAEP